MNAIPVYADRQADPSKRRRLSRDEISEIIRSRQMRIALYAMRVAELAEEVGAEDITRSDLRITLARPGATVFD